MALDRSPDLFAHQFYVLVLFFSVLVIPKCGRLCWPALWSTFRRTIKLSVWLDWFDLIDKGATSEACNKQNLTFNSIYTYCIVMGGKSGPRSALVTPRLCPFSLMSPPVRLTLNIPWYIPDHIINSRFIHTQYLGVNIPSPSTLVHIRVQVLGVFDAFTSPRNWRTCHN